MNGIPIIDYVLDPSCWIEYDIEQIHRSNHHLFNKPYGDDSSCVNCKSEEYKCDTCKAYVEHTNITCSLTDKKMYDILISIGIDKNIANHIAYDDEYDEEKYGYYIIWPTIEDVKSKYPDKYMEIIEHILLGEDSDDAFEDNDIDDNYDDSIEVELY